MRIIRQGDWFDCQVIRNRVFLWDTYGCLMVLDIRQAVYELIKAHGYKIEFSIHKDTVDKFIISSLRMKGGIYPVDSAYMGDHLYTATESGLYRRYLQEGESIAELPKGLAQKLIDIRFLELTAKADMIALSGASEGLFELYNPRKYRITKSGHETNEVSKGIYSVKKTYTKSAWYDRHDIISINQEGIQYRSRFNTSTKADASGKILRNYIKQDLIGDINERMLPARQTNPFELREVFLDILIDLRGNKEYQFMMRHFEEPVKIAGKPRKYVFGGFGMAAESRQEQVVVTKDGVVKRIDGPITRSRVVTGFGKRNGLLIVVRKDHVMITDCEND